jgi:hypothetical protein
MLGNRKQETGNRRQKADKDLFLLSAFCFLLSVFLTGCTQVNWKQALSQPQNQSQSQGQGQSQKQSQSQNQFEVTGDDEGFFFESEHYTLDIDRNLQKTQRFSMEKDRRRRAEEYLQGLERQYQYTKNTFGLDAIDKIKVHVITKSTTGAFASARIGPNGIEAFFPIEAFYERGARAHEIAHCFTMPLGLPAWLEEGIAVMVQLEYEPAGRYSAWRKQKSLNVGRFVDDRGLNSIQLWRGHSGGLRAKGGRVVSEEEAYIFCYALVLKLKELNGEDFYQKFFALLRENGVRRPDTNEVVYFMSQAAGKDLTPFFRELKFDVANIAKSQ